MTGLLQRATLLAAGRDALRLQAERLAQSYLSGPHGRRRAGSGDQFWQFRPYHAGDVPRDIDWRQSARRGETFVREREQAAAQSLWLAADRTASMDYSGDRRRLSKRDYAEVVVLAAALLALEAGERVGVLGASARAQSHAGSLPQLQEHLQAAPAVDALLAPPASRGFCLIASDFYFDLAALERLCAGIAARQGHAVLLQVCDPAEAAFDFSGRIRFEDPENAAAAALLVDDAAALGPEYRARFAAHRAALRDIARRHGGTFVAAETATPMADILEATLDAMAERR
jgi:uncharacterized protein (DUF58 family)